MGHIDFHINSFTALSVSSSYIEVAVALPVYKTFTYRIDDSLRHIVSVGKRVLVPFGQRIVTGYILGSCEDNSQKQIKLILDVLDDKPLFPPSMIPFFRWAADYYIHPIGEVIKSALPAGLNLYDFAYIHITDKGKTALLKDCVNPLEGKILNCLYERSFRHKDLCEAVNSDVPHSVISAMENCGWIIRKREIKGGRTKPKSIRYVKLGEARSATLNKRESFQKKLSKNRKRIIDALTEKGEFSVKDLKELVPTASNILRSMEKDGQVTIFEKEVYRDPFGEYIHPDTVFKLTDEQRKVISAVLNHLGSGFAVYLLAGVTGSGKTEVYMQLADAAVQKGLSVIVLVPEIALISQTERHFRSRFKEKVAILHSGLSAGERYDQWLRIASCEAKIAIGARSAVYAPFNNVGLIIVDEEHDSSYKQDGGFSYNARDLAILRANQNNGVALLGSATPSIESYYNAAKEKYFKTTLTKRVEDRLLPEVSIVDLKKNKDKRGSRRFISQILFDEMKKTLARGEQVLLFLNQRGFASHPVCAMCGEPVRCKKCSITLTLHKKTNAYRCHYCGYTRSSVSHCTICGSYNIKPLGIGTEKVEAAVNSLFPKANVARMDRDTTTRKGSILKILKGLRNNEIDVLVGTQMVAKGHDFSNITLVGIICADLSLNFPDFRACERTFQLLAQVSGRAGRGDALGKVVLQTYNPEHYSILTAKDQNYEAFYSQEIKFRKALNYPPFSRMVQIKISGKDMKKTKQQAFFIGDLCKKLEKNNTAFTGQVDVLGPIEAPIYKIASSYRWQILIKSSNTFLRHKFIHLMFKNASKINIKNVKVKVDVDPFFMM